MGVGIIYFLAGFRVRFWVWGVLVGLVRCLWWLSVLDLRVWLLGFLGLAFAGWLVGFGLFGGLVFSDFLVFWVLV